MYAQKSFKNRLTSFDVYKQLPKGYLQPTCVGAICKNKNYLIPLYSDCNNNIDVNLFIHV